MNDYKFQIFAIRLLCAILELLLFPNMRSTQITRSAQFLLSNAQAYTLSLEKEKITEKADNPPIRGAT